MSFTVDEEREFHRRRDELGRDFAAWAERNRVEAGPAVVDLLLDWKWSYADGELGRWSVPDVAEFLLEWCPRKLTVPLELCAEIPPSVASFVDFLAHTGLLAPDSQPPSALRRYCQRIVPTFRRAMSNPANFGMAKSLFAGGGDGDLGERLGELGGIDLEELAAMVEENQPPPIGLVRLPSPADHLDSLRAATTFGQVRALAQRCPTPGLAVTARGNLRLAEARRLVTELRTGDDVQSGPRSAAELTGLGWVLEVATTAGAVTVADGRMLADPEFAALDDPAAYLRIVDAAIDLGLAPRGHADRSVEQQFLDDSGPHLLARLLDAHADGDREVPVTDLLDAVVEVAQLTLDHYSVAALGDGLNQQLERLLELGVVGETGTPSDPEPGGQRALRLTPAGVSVAAELVAELLDIEVVTRPDPTRADGRTMAAALLLADRPDAEADLGTWFGVQPDPAAAAAELLAELAAGDVAPADVLAGLDLAGVVLGTHAETAALAQLDGPHELLVVTWLVSRGALDPQQVDPHRLLGGMVDVAAAMIDTEGPAAAVEFVGDSDPDQVRELLDELWRVVHPRVGEVLEALGRHHPDRSIAKAARKNLMRYRNRIAQ